MLKSSPFPGHLGVIDWTMPDTCTEAQNVLAHIFLACNSYPFPRFKNSTQDLWARQGATCTFVGTSFQGIPILTSTGTEDLEVTGEHAPQQLSSARREHTGKKLTSYVKGKQGAEVQRGR